MNDDQRVSRLRPAHVVDDAAADRRGQIVVARRIDVGNASTVLDDVHSVVREAQHVRVIDRELERHQAHAVACRLGAGMRQLVDMLQAWPAAQSTLRLDQHIGRLGQRVRIGLQVNPRTQQRVELPRREVGGEVDEARHQFLTAIKV